MIKKQRPSCSKTTAREIPIITFCQEEQKFKFAQEFSKDSKPYDTNRYELFFENAKNFAFRLCNPPKTTPVVYHYCSVQALENIIRDRSFRLTDSVCVNDSEEMKWGYKKLGEILSKIHKEYKDVPKTKEAQLGVFETSQHEWPDEVKSFISALRNADAFPEEVEQFATLISEGMAKKADEMVSELFLEQEFFGKVFVGCFSDNADQLSQWRGYGDDGRGVSIGFNRTLLERFGTCDSVRYYSNQQEHFIKTFLGSHLRGDCPFDMWCLGVLPFLKPFGFHEEREYRIVYSPMVHKKLPHEMYLTGKTIRQCYSLPISTKSIVEIVLGPKCNQDRSDLEVFFEKCGLPVPAISSSKLSYR